MSMPNYTLNDHIGWATTRKIPLCSQAITQLNTLLNPEGEFASFRPKFAGINTGNNLAYVHPLNHISNNEDFYEDAGEIIIPHNLLNFIEFDYLLNGTAFTSQMITDLLAVVGATSEFAGFLTALDGITPGNCLQYTTTIYQLLECPKFLFDAMLYSI